MPQGPWARRSSSPALYRRWVSRQFFFFNQNKNISSVRVCIFDAPSNKVNIRQDPDSGNLVSFNAQHTACIVNPATREFYLYYFDPKLPEVPPRKIVIKAKDDLDFKELALTTERRMRRKRRLTFIQVT